MIRTLLSAIAVALLATTPTFAQTARFPGVFVAVGAPAQTTKQATDPGGNVVTVPDQPAPGVFYIAPTAVMTPALTPYIAPANATPPARFAGEPTTALRFDDAATAQAVLSAWTPRRLVDRSTLLARLAGKEGAFMAALQAAGGRRAFLKVLMGAPIYADDADVQAALTTAGADPAAVLAP